MKSRLSILGRKTLPLFLPIITIAALLSCQKVRMHSAATHGALSPRQFSLSSAKEVQSSTTAALYCDSVCAADGAYWNGHWTNTQAVSEGNGICECIRGADPYPDRQAKTFLLQRSHIAELYGDIDRMMAATNQLKLAEQDGDGGGFGGGSGDGYDADSDTTTRTKQTKDAEGKVKYTTTTKVTGAGESRTMTSVTKDANGKTISSKYDSIAGDSRITRSFDAARESSSTTISSGDIVISVKRIKGETKVRISVGGVDSGAPKSSALERAEEMVTQTTSGLDRAENGTRVAAAAQRQKLPGDPVIAGAARKAEIGGEEPSDDSGAGARSAPTESGDLSGKSR